jgi:agmatine deiminase
VLVELKNNLLQPRYSPLILDGGNIVKSKNKVIITDRVFKDNMFQFKSEEDILTQLEEDLQCKVIIVPEFPGEITGHADGLIRFINEKTVFINETKDEKEEAWSKSFLSVLSENQLRPIKVPCQVTASQKTANGLYINYLHLGNLIVFPQFNMKEDDTAFQTFKEVFHDKTIVPFDARWIAKYAGVFNCSTWTIKT